ncbi:transmembrane protein 221 [Pseudonaja textilis]|uniref:transmembrane protein 221 n=1 Tax=Pseudonaja textilis TaxID=8673 RepID=UPI000EAA5D93|nr:transmembrane protein 221 [Pseudonaja textilis]
MLSQYGHRALGALMLLGTASGLVAVLASMLLFQIQGSAHVNYQLPGRVFNRLNQSSAALASLSLVLSLSCLLLSLLHGYCGAERCAASGGALGSERGDWFLLESRKVRHVAVGVFCCAVLAYLAALSTYVTMAFQRETGITCACIFSSGVVVLIITVIHVLIRASKATQRSVSHNLYENDSAQSGETPTVVPPSDAPKMASSQSRLEIHPEVSYLSYMEQKSHQTTPASSTNVTSVDGIAATLEKEGCSSIPRMHRTLLAESGLLLSHGMRQEKVLSRKPAGSGKDSTLV